jgi:Molecular chaperone
MDFGIDFGTTNSACTGILEKRREIPYRDNFGNPFPSLIVIDRVTGEVFCGRDAWRKREELSESCEIIPSVKTHLGTDKTWQVAGKIWTPVMVATEVFLGIKQQVARGAGNVQLEQAVVAVPVGFSSEKRKN